MSHRVTLTGADLEEFRAFILQAFSSQYGEVSEMRIAVSSGQVCVGVNGFVSEWLGKKVEDGKDSEQSDLINQAIALLHKVIDQNSLP